MDDKTSLSIKGLYDCLKEHLSFYVIIQIWKFQALNERVTRITYTSYSNNREFRFLRKLKKTIITDPNF